MLNSQSTASLEVCFSITKCGLCVILLFNTLEVQIKILRGQALGCNSLVKTEVHMIENIQLHQMIDGCLYHRDKDIVSRYSKMFLF